MASAIEFVLRLRDMVSGPASKASAALGRVSKGLEGVDKASAKTGPSAAGHVDRIAKSADRGGSALRSFAAGAGAAVAAMAVAGVVKFGEGVARAATFKEDMGRALKIILGSESAASAAIARARMVADQVGGDPMTTIEGFRNLLAQGFKLDEVERLVKNLADLKVVNPEANAKGLIRTINQIRAAGRLQGDELNELGNNGVAASVVYEALAKKMKKTVPEIVKLKEAGKISAADAIEAIQMGISQTVGGGPAGAAAAARASGTISGILDQIKGRAVGLVLDLEVPGAEGVRTLLQNISSALDGSTATGQRLRQVLGAVLGAVGGLVSRLLDAGGGAMLAGLARGLELVAGLVTKLLPVVEAFVTGWISGLSTGTGAVESIFEALTALAGVLAENAAAIGMVARVVSSVMVIGLRLAGAAAQAFTASIGVVSTVFGAVGSAIVYVGGLVLGLVETFVSAGSAIVSAVVSGFYGAIGFLIELPGKAMELGTAIVDGIVSGISAGASKIADAVKGAAGGAIDTAKAVLGIASPSKQFRWIGEMSAQGWAIGLAANDNPARAAGQLAGGTIAGAFGGGAAAAPAGGGVHVGTVELHFHGSGETIEATARRAAAVFLEEVAAATGARAA